MGVSQLGCAGFLILGAFLLLTSCPGPTYDQTLLRSVKVEADRLKASAPAATYKNLPKPQWPKAIASLEPEVVWVGRHRVEVLMEPSFDGGWGYVIEDKRRPSDLPECFSEVAPDVYWHGPC